MKNNISPFFSVSSFFENFANVPQKQFELLVSEKKHYRGKSSFIFWKKWESERNLIENTLSDKLEYYKKRITQLKQIVDFDNLIYQKRKDLNLKKKSFDIS